MRAVSTLRSTNERWAPTNRVCVQVLQTPWPTVLLLCSGTAGKRSDEDEIFAGAMAEQLLAAVPGAVEASGELAGVTAEVLRRVREPVERCVDTPVPPSNNSNNNNHPNSPPIGQNPR